jgi:hypothetical protein
MIDIKYKTITISSMLDCHVNGEKRSTFISVQADLGGVSVEEFRIGHLKVGLEVAVAAVQQALCRQELTDEQARTRVNEYKENYNGFIKALEERAKAKPTGEEDPPF